MSTRECLREFWAEKAAVEADELAEQQEAQGDYEYWSEYFSDEAQVDEYWAYRHASLAELVSMGYVTLDKVFA